MLDLVILTKIGFQERFIECYIMKIIPIKHEKILREAIEYPHYLYYADMHVSTSFT